MGRQLVRLLPRRAPHHRGFNADYDRAVFNAETFVFEADYPLQMNFVAKDFNENDTGLEYIGRRNQQMDDGDLIAQFTDATIGNAIAVTDSS